MSFLHRRRFRRVSSGGGGVFEEAVEAAKVIEQETFEEAGKAATADDDGIEILQFPSPLFLDNDVLHTAISDEFFRLGPNLRSACKRFIMEVDPAFLAQVNPKKDINVAFCNLPLVKRFRELGTGEIGKLVSVRGVVTWTGEVRLELLRGTFKCLDCDTVVRDVEQQFKYTEVLILR